MKKLILIILMVIIPIFYVDSNIDFTSNLSDETVAYITDSKEKEPEFVEVILLSDDEIKEAKEDTIRETLLDLGLTPYVTELIVAQSKHESEKYSNGLTKYNNVFGRHYSPIDTLALGAGAWAEGHNKFAKYPSIKAAAISQYQYLVRKNYSFKWKTARQYAIELKKKHYYEASIDLYAKALRAHSRWDSKKQGLKD